jgi:aminoglycoside 6'-N-acetyltransferase Ib
MPSTLLAMNAPVTPYIAMLAGQPIGCAQSYVALGSGVGWWEEADPAPNNRRALRCYEKAGFRQIRTIVTPDGPAMVMLQDRPSAAGTPDASS